MTLNNQIDQFVWIRILASFCVIVLNELYVSFFYFGDTMLPGEVIWSRLMVNELTWAMPCFLMITGVLLLDQERELPLRKLFGKYLRRILLALVCFTLIIRIVEYKIEGRGDIAVGWLHDLVTGQSWSYLWYLYLMVGIYLMMPFYRMIVAKADDRMLDFLLLILIVFTSIFPIFGVFGLPIGFYLPTAIVYPAYVFLGYRLYHRPLHTGAAAALLIGCTLAILALTWARYGTDLFAAMAEDPDNQLDDLFGYSSILVMGQTAGLFMLMNRIKSPAGLIARSIDRCTLGIYLMHMIGVRVIMEWLEFNPYWYGPFTFVLMAAVLFLLTFGVTWVIRKIPRLNLL